MRKLPTFTLTIIAALAMAAPAFAGSPRHFPRGPVGGPDYEQGQFRLSVGTFEPRGDSEFWDGNSQLFTGSASDLKDVMWGGDFLWSINANASVMFSLETVEGATTQSYRGDYLEGGAPISHRTKLEVTPFTVGLVFYPAGKKAPVIPYLGFGGGLYWWRYTENGDFIFNDEALPIFTGEYRADGVQAGFFGVAGLDIPVQKNWSVFAEVRYHKVRAEMGDDFDGMGKIDLSGPQVSAGVAWRF